MKKIIKKLKPIIFVVLITFSWVAVGGWNYAYAFEVKSTKQIQKIETAGSLISKEIADIEKVVEKAERKTKRLQNIDEEVRVLKNKYGIIKSLDKKAREEFANTEKFLKSKGISKKVLDRHYNFVKQYEENIAKLNQKLEEIDKSGKTNQNIKITELKQFLKQSVYHPKIRPINPNKLPHRSIKHPHRKPRLSQTTPEDKTQLSLRANEISEAIPIKSVVTQLVERNVVVQFIGQILNIITPSVEAADLPTSADLAPTLEVQITDEIRNLATVTLKSNPVLIYEYVRNNFAYEPYYGSLKGAVETLWEKAGNDFDQASLLIALLRAANIPARYVYGTVEIPIERAMNWVGVEDKRTCGDLFASAGIPATLVSKGGEIASLQIEHCWVEAWVTFDYLGGAIQTPRNKMWISLDPSFKQYLDVKPIDLAKGAGIDIQSFLNQIQSGSTVNTDGSVVVNENLLNQKSNEIKTQLENYINTQFPNGTLYDVLGYKNIKEKKLGMLPTTLPYHLKLRQTSYSQIPDFLRYKVNFEIGSSNYTITSVELIGKRITISYIAATSEDQVILQSYDNIEDVPAYLINMKGLLRIGGVRKLEGTSQVLGSNQEFKMTFINPDGMSDIVINEMVVGSYYAVGINFQKIPRDVLKKSKIVLQNTIDKINLGTGTIALDEVLGEYLYATAIAYFAELDGMNTVTGRMTKVKHIRFPSEAMTGIKLQTNYFFNIPRSVDVSGIFIDVDKDEHLTIPQTGDKNTMVTFGVASGMSSSFLEQSILKQMTNASSLSALCIIQIANHQGIPIYNISSSNVSSVIDLLEVDESTKTDIRNVVNSGMIVTIPKSEIYINGWIGIGYIVIDPTTGSGAYMISGGISGGSTVPPPEGDRIALGGGLASAGSSELDGVINIFRWLDRLMAIGNFVVVGYNVYTNLERIEELEFTPEIEIMLYSLVVALGLISIIIQAYIVSLSINPLGIVSMLYFELYVLPIMWEIAPIVIQLSKEAENRTK